MIPIVWEITAGALFPSRPVAAMKIPVFISVCRHPATTEPSQGSAAGIIFFRNGSLTLRFISGKKDPARFPYLCSEGGPDAGTRRAS
jgi:hypothetical protein